MSKCAWAVLAVLVLASTALGRPWTSDKGTTIEAEYVGQKDGKILLFYNGNIVELSPNQLSADDQRFAAEAERSTATDVMSKKIAEDPKNATNFVARGMARVNKGQHDEAIIDYNIALALDPKNPEAHDGRGVAFKKKGDAAKAHNDYTKAIELNEKFPAAYRHRAENLLEYIKTPEGKPIYEKAKAEFDKNRDKMAKASFDHAPWQPVHSTRSKEPADGAIMQPMILADQRLYERYQPAWGGSGGGGGWGGGGYGGGPGVIGPGVIGPGPIVAPGVNAALAVYPPVVVKGETVTLQANPAELAKGMPTKVKPGAKGPAGAAPPSIEGVDFYRDSNGDGKFQPGTDKYLASDKDGKDGFSAEVSTADFPLGNMAYFAVPKSAVAAADTLPLAANLLTALAEAEAKIAKEAEAAKSSGLTADKADALSKEQAQIAGKISSIANDVKQAAPEVAKLLADTRKPMGETKGELYKATKTPGPASMASTAKAGAAADVAAKQLAMAAEQLTKAASGDEPPKPGSPGTGRPAAANGMINAPEGKEGPGKGGPGGPGKGGEGGYGRGKDGVDVVENDDDYFRRRWGDRILEDGIDIVSDEDRVVVGERARRYVDDRDYDRAVVEYNRLLVDEPDNSYYLRNRAHTYLARGGYQDAIADYNHLITLDTENADFYYNRGCANLAAGKLDAAVADFDKSIQLNETGHLAYNNRGITHARQGQFALAVTDFTKALSLQPNDRLAYHNRGLAYSKLGKNAEAEADLAKARQLGEGG